MSDPTETRTEKLALSYRPFTDNDLAAVYGLSSQINWPHRVDDWRFVAQAGEGFVAEDASGVVGTALCWKYGGGQASLGMVIVSPERQGHGIGRKLMELLLEAVGGRTTLLHATVAGKPLYEKLGFREIGTTNQHQGTAFQPPLLSLPPGERLRPLGSNDTQQLVALASRASGLDRSALLPSLLELSDGIALDRDGELLGFALFRRFGRGYAIGPVVAPDSDDSSRAKALISHWLARNEGVFVRIDTPGDSGISEWLDGLGLVRVDTVAKMARNSAPRADHSVRQFAIINQAVC
ncbi:GNAT family N-acetyltransferase [Paraburkholderia hospita]|uniref:N-acetyltransferase GCN5 n=1 Tax=Paraburkholderia hospita TaxID=169430 RepID=A0ABP2PU41_9BURK|nr:GNAT family N-acetyltransferase [Paraburkholderia hospita]EIN01339.1 N-acetyltransferase GCN5 [Paraburkholderia hospita]OUL85522.1 N-acetyltransferase [Paraburkholderia hospita]SEI15417.1 Predicted N-acetyltransferase YhbS [Paraburkholderia hospita]